MKTIKDTCYKGTVIRVGNEKRDYLNRASAFLMAQGYEEISIPAIQYAETFADKVGAENNNLMFRFTDRKARELCLAPEYTAVCQRLALTVYRDQRDVCLFYIQECFRGERQQRGRWRQFTQLGVEVLNPVDVGYYTIRALAIRLFNLAGDYYSEINENVVRGLDYYKGGRGFEIRGNGLQLCGGGEYDGGIGFAIGVDRLLMPRD